MTSFLYRALVASGRYTPEVISLSMSARDDSSVLLRSPRSWFKGVQVADREVDGIRYQHVGAYFSDFEFQRYRTRRVLTQLLNEYDLLQFVVGTASWAAVADAVAIPSLIWTASTVRADRAARLAQGQLHRRVWGTAMARCALRQERQALRRARLVFALSNYTRSMVLSIAPATNVALGVCGVDVNRFSPSPDRSGNYILAAGRFSDARKNLPLLLKAYDRLSDRNDLPDLYLAGQLPDKVQMRWISRLKTAGKLRFLGYKTLAELAELYRNACIFALSSDEEGLGIVILEAMASGIPVVSTDCGGPSSCVVEGVTGFLVPTDDIDSFANALSKLLDNPHMRKSMGCAAREIAKQKFSKEVTSRAFIEAYESILN